MGATCGLRPANSGFRICLFSFVVKQAHTRLTLRFVTSSGTALSAQKMHMHVRILVLALATFGGDTTGHRWRVLYQGCT